MRNSKDNRDHQQLASANKFALLPPTRRGRVRMLARVWHHPLMSFYRLKSLNLKIFSFIVILK